MIQWKEEITELNMRTQLDVIDQLQLKEEEKYNIFIISAPDSVKRWIIERAGEKSWATLKAGIKSEQFEKGQMEQGLSLIAKCRKREEDPEKFERDLITMYKRIDRTISDDCLMKFLTEQIYPANKKAKDRISFARNTEDMLYRIRELGITKQKEGKNFCTKCQKPEHAAEKCRRSNN